jgi:hypothetical protein
MLATTKTNRLIGLVQLTADEMVDNDDAGGISRTR